MYDSRAVSGKEAKTVGRLPIQRSSASAATTKALVWKTICRAGKTRGRRNVTIRGLVPTTKLLTLFVVNPAVFLPHGVTLSLISPRYFFAPFKFSRMADGSDDGRVRL